MAALVMVPAFRILSGIQDAAAAQQGAAYWAHVRTLVALVAAASLGTLLMTLAFVHLVPRSALRRLESTGSLETRHLHGIQAETNRALRSTNHALQLSEARLAVTLHSIGDAVIATDAEGRVTLLNPLAEKLTGWTQSAAAARPAAEIFRIVDRGTRRPSPFPLEESLAQGTLARLANHSVRSRGTEASVRSPTALHRFATLQVRWSAPNGCSDTRRPTS